MAHDVICPACGEAEDLHGDTDHAGGIRVTCGACGHAWDRGGPRCARCGRTDLAQRPQETTQYSRGTQLSIVGWRQVLLCPECDEAALRASVQGNRAVPGDYVPAASTVHRREALTEAPTASRAQPTARPPSAGAARRTSTAATAPKPTQRLNQPAPPRPAAAKCPATSPFTPAARTVTMRQATNAFLTHATETAQDADAAAMLLIATNYGQATPVRALDADGEAERFAAWFELIWGDRDTTARTCAAETLRAALGFWRAQGWLSTDPAAHLAR